jgi:hypothetical protein
MTNPSHALAPNGRTRPSELVWTGSEKKTARKALDAALKQELKEVIQEPSRGPVRSRSLRNYEIWRIT